MNLYFQIEQKKSSSILHKMHPPESSGFHPATDYKTCKNFTRCVVKLHVNETDVLQNKFV